MSNKDNSDSLDSLFADALKAVEKTKVKKVQPETADNDLELDIDIEVESESESSSEQEGIETSVNSEEYEALLEAKAHLDLQYDQLRQQMQTLHAENQRLQERLASAHTHMQSMIQQRNKFRDQNKNTQEEIEKQNQRIRSLEGTINRQKQQIDKSGAMRRKEQQELKKYGASNTLKKLLPALDSLDLAVKNGQADPESLQKGLQLVQNQFIDALYEAGVVRVSSNPGDKFNPAHHEAVMRVPSDTIDTNHIVECFCGAYTLHDRLLRAAMVSVAAPKK